MYLLNPAYCAAHIRLVNGHTLYEGRIEVFYNGEWGTVCDDLWDIADAEVACKELGFSGAVEFRKSAFFGQGEGTIWLDDVECWGNESHLERCQHEGWGQHDGCSHGEDAGVVCKVDIRLADGGSANEGRVEVFYDGTWGTINDESWDITDASVVCRELGFPGAVSAHSYSYFGPGTGPEWLQSVKCTNQQRRLYDCHRNEWVYRASSHCNDAAVVCQPGVRLINGSTSNEGRFEIYHDGTWGTVCDDGWHTNDANVACRELGYPAGGLPVNCCDRFGQASGTVWLEAVKCKGTEKNIQNCFDPDSMDGLPWGANTCSHKHDVGVVCNAKWTVRLRGGSRINEGRVEVYHRGGWGTICPSFSWDTRDAAVICKQLGFPGGMSAPPSAHFGRGSGPVWFGIVDCNGDEKIFDECHRYGLGAHYCSHSKDASVVCRNLGAPSKVVNVTLSHHENNNSLPSVKASWAPVDGHDITYKVCYSLTAELNIEPPSTSYCITGITETTIILFPPLRGTSYAVWIAARNRIGLGDYSYRQLIRTYKQAGPVSSLSTEPIPQAGSVRVSWRQPHSYNPYYYFSVLAFAPLKGYMVEYKAKNSSLPYKVLSLSNATTSVDITGLLRGTTYEIRVAAVSTIGTAAYTKDYVRTHDAPFRIASLNATTSIVPKQQTIVVYWNAPSSDLPISSYEVQYRIQNDPWQTSNISGSFLVNSAHIDAVNLGKTYEVRVRAISTIGAGPFGDTQSTRTYNVPEKIVLVSIIQTVQNGKQILDVQWTPPHSDFPIEKYIVMYSAINSNQISNVTVKLNRFRLEKLEIGTIYQISVVAVSLLGESLRSEWKSTSMLQVPAPSNVSSHMLKPGMVRITWNRPEIQQKLRVIGYSIQYRKEAGMNELYVEKMYNSTSVVGKTESVDVDGLQVGQVYSFHVAIVTTGGVGTYSNPINVITDKDCRFSISEETAIFATFQVDSLKVSEADTTVHVEVYRYGRMLSPVTVRVADEPGTASNILDYALQQQNLTFIKTHELVEKKAVVVRIKDDSIPESGAPEYFKLALHSVGSTSKVVFPTKEISISIVDND
jgi:hypothetical protein